MTSRKGDGLNGAVGTTEAGGVVEFGNTNTPPIAATAVQLQELIAALAGLFPSTFVADRWKPHRPLKVGIHQDLIDHGVLLPRECRALRWYVARRMYQVALAAGGPRYDLDGNVAGEVTPEEADQAKAAVAAIEAKQERKAKAVADEKRAARKATKAPTPPKTPRQVQPATAARSANPARLSLADLKAAARARREAQGGAPSGGAP